MPPRSANTPNFSRPLPSPFAEAAKPPKPLSKEDLRSPSAASASNKQSQTSPPGASEIDTTSPFTSRVRQWRALSKAREKSALEALEPLKTLTLLGNDIGAMDKPIMEFRPQIFPHLDPKRPILNIDLFWPIKDEDMNDADEKNSDGDQKGVFPFQDLKPLVSFRNLHVLELHGMMRSYQPIIWETCWVNTKLSKLTLEMALEPEFNDEMKSQYKKFDTNWKYDGSIPRFEEPTEYLGSHGTGELHPEFGSGEYLDRNAMKQAQVAVATQLPVENIRYLPITTLNLSNFAVDAGPFFRWFDPKGLKEVNFKGACWDTGFYLPNEMRRVVVVSGPVPVLSIGGQVFKPGELKVVTLSKGKVVKREAWDGKNHLPEEAGAGAGDGGASGVGGGKSLKSKVSQALGLGKKGAKESEE